MKGRRQIQPPLAARGAVELAFRWAHTRRYFHKELDQKNPEETPIAAEALSRIQHLYAIEAEIRGRSAEERRAVRQEKSAPVLTALKPWLAARLDLLSKKSDLAKALNYTLDHWEGLNRFLDDGRIEIDNNTVERAIRPLTPGRKNHLLAGSEGGAEHWAILASLIATCKINDVEPQAYLTDVDHRLTKPKHPWTNGQVERMNRTLKEATVKRDHYDTHDQLRRHLDDFVAAYNFARRLKTLKGLTPFEAICRTYTREPNRFTSDPTHQLPGPNI